MGGISVKIFKKSYHDKLRKHYETYFKTKGKVKKLTKGPTEKLHPDFYILEIPPNSMHSMWVYLTVGMSFERTDENLIELFIFSPEQKNEIVELLTICASFHRNNEPLNIHHTVYIGQPWLNDSECDHGFISLPYLDGDKLDVFEFENKKYRFLWFIPITEKERNYKIDNGCEMLEQLFEENQIDYLNPKRKCLIIKKSN